ncbi:MAG TPA: hypothetical protein VJM50_18545 [Pyrinomonadaceae bacterium]|nr:hypothetical protein [Pyrinomonadaceae bacterium]
MILNQFDVRGEQINDEETEEIIRHGDPHRSLVRYRPDGSENFVYVRINVALLQAAVSLPIVLVKPQSRKDEVLWGFGDLLSGEGSVRNYELLGRICEDATSASFPACYLAEQHGGTGRRDFFFVTEDVAGFERIARTAAEAWAFPLTIEQYSLAELAPIILPAEAIGDLNLELPADARMRLTRFEFWGAEPSLAKLRAHLERRGYRFLSFEIATRELRMIKEVPIDGPGFQAVLKEIVPLARSLRCSYLGTETVGGLDQFLLTRPLPERYASDSPTGGIFRRIFGRKGQ